MFVGIVVPTFCRIDDFIDDFAKKTIAIVVNDIRELRRAVEITQITIDVLIFVQFVTQAAFYGDAGNVFPISFEEIEPW